MTVICLVRHGETDWNKQQRIQGRSNIPLNERGIEQVREAQEGIWKTKWDIIYTSPLQRAAETGHLLNESYTIPIQIKEEWIEKSFGDVEGKEYSYVFSTYPDGVFPRAETDEAVIDRVLPLFDEIAHEHAGKNILIVTHGAIIHALLRHFNAYQETLEDVRLHPLSMHTFMNENNEWIVESYNQLPE